MKTCFKCGTSKPIREFYKHSKMADGRLGKCKDCTKQDTKNARLKNLKNIVWVLKERRRCRLKQEQYRKEGTAQQISPAAKKQWVTRNPEKRSAHGKANRAYQSGTIKKPSHCPECGKLTAHLQMHHDDYSKPLDIRWMCTKCHGRAHWKMNF